MQETVWQQTDGPLKPAFGYDQKIADITRMRDSEFFQSLTEEELTRVSSFSSDFAVVENGLLFAEGRSASHLYIVTEGRIALQKTIRVPRGNSPRRTLVTAC